MLTVENITFSYQKHPVLEDVSFDHLEGKHLAIMGESGSGKSTLLKAIYGLLHLDEGAILWNGDEVLGPNFNLVPGEKTMKYVSQDFDLMPFTNVSENVGEHLSVFDREHHHDRIQELLDIVGLQDFANTKVKSLSGGQQQRVALARALAQEPELLLLDEPFSSIDQFKKNELRHRLFPYLKAKGVTVITATHDPEDVLPFSDDIIVLRNGQKIAFGNTTVLYKNPREKYIATLFGQVNALPIGLLKEYAKQDQTILVYPHEFEISASSGVEVTVKKSFFRGSHYLTEGLAENGQTVLFQSKKRIDSDILVYLNIPLELVNLRLSNLARS
ncbi:ABC transporter ATP-binding protein [Allomuricauda sp. d1]|uniref:ABC transporter ATP-binding protein n=1 Tax=Allomuricauda sp. d1 TaxID=3136725 RepID=UPI0031E46F54